MAYLGNSFNQQMFTPATDFFSGNGVTTTFTLTRPLQSIYGIEVVVNNVLQNPSNTYSINASNQLTFVAAPSAGTNNIYVNYNAPISQVNGIGQGTVQASALAGPNAPTWDTTGNLTINGALVSQIAENVRTSDYTLALSDRALVVAMNNSSAATVTVPPESSVFFPIGTILYICRVGAGAVTLAAGAGVSLSKTGTFGSNEQITIRKRASNTWIIVDSPTNPAAIGGTFSQASGYKINSFTAGSGTLTVG